MRDKPWIGEKGSVLEWLSDQTGLPTSTSSAKPTGTLTFISPRELDGKPKQYALPEVMGKTRVSVEGPDVLATPDEMVIRPLLSQPVRKPLFGTICRPNCDGGLRSQSWMWV